MTPINSHRGEKSVAIIPTIVFTLMFGVIMTLLGFIWGDASSSNKQIPDIKSNRELATQNKQDINGIYILLQGIDDKLDDIKANQNDQH